MDTNIKNIYTNNKKNVSSLSWIEFRNSNVLDPRHYRWKPARPQDAGNKIYLNYIIKKLNLLARLIAMMRWLLQRQHLIYPTRKKSKS